MSEPVCYLLVGLKRADIVKFFTEHVISLVKSKHLKIFHLTFLALIRHFIDKNIIHRKKLLKLLHEYWPENHENQLYCAHYLYEILAKTGSRLQSVNHRRQSYRSYDDKIVRSAIPFFFFVFLFLVNLLNSGHIF